MQYRVVFMFGVSLNNGGELLMSGTTKSGGSLAAAELTYYKVGNTNSTVRSPKTHLSRMNTRNSHVTPNLRFVQKCRVYRHMCSTVLTLGRKLACHLVLPEKHALYSTKLCFRQCHQGDRLAKAAWVGREKLKTSRQQIWNRFQINMRIRKRMRT
jgi:hypothetical protein